MNTRNQELQLLEQVFGIHFPGSIDLLGSALAMDARNWLLGMDAAPPNAAQYGLVTEPNAAIPAFLTNFIDPELTRVLTSPSKAAMIFGEQRKGDWTTLTATFPIVESTGEVSSYGDYNNNGSSDANMNYEPRQSYHFQSFTRWGDRELEMAGLAKIDLAAEKNLACAINFQKFLNKTYFFGVSGLDNFGWLNDPSLPASITPADKAGNSDNTWIGATGVEIFTDIQSLYRQLQSQLNGNIDLESPMKLTMSSLRQALLTTPMSNVYGTTTVEDILKKTFPNLRVMTAVEYSTDAGELLQLVVEQVEGQRTGFCAYTERMRAHSIVRETSSTHQKKSAGTWGAIVKLPAGVASMLGI